ncbi:MAG TPA: hypothetical protein VFZ66_04130 [Herpetosiphonaceae bacterium]
MTDAPIDKLYPLLPAIYRIRDAEQGEPLKALLTVLAEQLQVVEDDIARLYDNWFVETCDEWVAPYIGDLLRVRGLHPVSTTTFSQRAQVANTLRYRRRKGTATMLEQLARDTTGWNARAVEFFQLLATTQHVNHIRLQNVRTPDLRNIDALELLDTPFDTIAHTADVRRIARGRGRHNIPNIGLFLWRLQAFPLLKTDAAADGPGRFRFSSLGNDLPLFNQPQTETDIGSTAAEINVPGVLRRYPLYAELEALRQALVDGDPPRLAYFADPQVLQIFLPGQTDPVPPEEILICHLADWREPPATKEYTRRDGTTVARAITVAVDPLLGRIAFPAGVAPGGVRVSYAYGFSGNVGGGPYERRRPPQQPGDSQPFRVDPIADPSAFGSLIRVPSPGINTIGAALAIWNPATPRTVIQIDDSRTYAEDLTIALTDTELIIQAANTQRPTLLGDIALSGGDRQARLTINGLLIAGQIRVQDNLPELNLLHCTLVPGRHLDETGQPTEPGRPSVVVDAANDRLRLTIERSIVGPLRLPATMDWVRAQDSIIDSPALRPLPTLIGGGLPAALALTSATPTLDVTIGDEGPHPVTLAAAPTTPAQARDQLQAALQAAHASPAFASARVALAANRLIVLPGTRSRVTIANAAADPTATELRLTDAARQVQAMISRPLTPFPTLTSATPTLNVTIGDEGPHPAVLAAVPTTVPQARDHVQTAIRNAHSGAAFTGTFVVSVDDRLLVLPGADDTPIIFSAAPADPTTFVQLGLESELAALAADDTGAQPGPPATLERTTIFGAVHVQSLTLASEVIFVDPVIADRRQLGCVRFSFVPDGSRVPQPYRCQPDLATRQAIDAALIDNSALTPIEKQQIAATIRVWLRPSFTARQYGQPAYAQLGRFCPDEIRTGAENEAEMGVFNFLMQPQREANLRANLDEYLRFGLEAGILFVT